MLYLASSEKYSTDFPLNSLALFFLIFCCWLLLVSFVLHSPELNSLAVFLVSVYFSINNLVEFHVDNDQYANGFQII